MGLMGPHGAWAPWGGPWAPNKKTNLQTIWKITVHSIHRKNKNYSKRRTPYVNLFLFWQPFPWTYVSLNLFTSTCLDVLDDGWNALGWILSFCSVLGCILRSWGLLSCILSSWSLLGWILGSWSLRGLDSELLGSCKFKRSSWFLEENNNTVEQL